MRRFLFSIIFVFLCSMGIYSAPTVTYADPIDLNGFGTQGDVLISPDGSAAALSILGEYGEEYGDAMLQNDPIYYGDPGINVGANDWTISFYYDFFEVPENDTLFIMSLYDGESGELLTGFDIIDTVEVGYFEYHYSSPDDISLLGMDFILLEYAYNNDVYNLGSFATIYNMDLTINEVEPVPEPTTLLLLSTGIAALGGFKLRKRYR